MIGRMRSYISDSIANLSSIDAGLTFDDRLKIAAYLAGAMFVAGFAAGFGVRSYISRRRKIAWQRKFG